jgi:hypothetical protein
MSGWNLDRSLEIALSTGNARTDVRIILANKPSRTDPTIDMPPAHIDFIAGSGYYTLDQLNFRLFGNGGIARRPTMSN